MDRIGPVDQESQTVEVQAGVRGDRLEEELARSDLTTGHYPQSVAISTVGGWIAASSAGQASTGFGAIEDVLLGLTAVLPDGEILRCRAVPRSAAGPDLRRLLIGSEGTLAVVTEATLACRARPTAWEWLAFGFADFTTMAGALKDVKRAETGAAVLRGYDETDAQLGFGALNHTTGCVALAGFPAGPAGRPAWTPGNRPPPRFCKQTAPNSPPATASTGGSTATTRCRPSRRSWGRSARSAPG